MFWVLFAWYQAYRNWMAGLQRCNSVAVAADIISRYPHCYLINSGFVHSPAIAFDEYKRVSPKGAAPMVRVDWNTFDSLGGVRRGDGLRFHNLGATLAKGDGAMPLPTGALIVRMIAEVGWRILTVDDARCIINSRDTSNPNEIRLNRSNVWVRGVNDEACRHGIAENLFPICEQVVATQTAVMVIFTPGLPRPFRLWRKSLKGIMPPLPSHVP